MSLLQHERITALAQELRLIALPDHPRTGRYGTTITKSSSFEADELEYLHIELDRREVILAEGAPAEALCGGTNRMAFDNYDGYAAMYGAGTIMRSYTPIFYGGRQELHSKNQECDRTDPRSEAPLDIIGDSLADRGNQQAAA